MFLRSSIIAILLPALTLAQPKPPEPGGEKTKDPAMIPIVDDPTLPRVLLIGDSISIGYTLPTRDLLKGKANLHRILTNGGPTTNGVKNLDAWLGEGKWEIIHFNFGLHDLKIMDGGKHQVELEDYEKNLRAIVDRLKKTNAKLIFATTTPVPEGKLNPPRNPRDVEGYNAAALKVMNDSGVAINDLYTFALPKLKDIQQPANVHFAEKGSEALAKEVAAAITAALEKK